MTTFFDQEVMNLQKDNNYFHATTANGTYTARKVILASGLKDDLPNVPGLRDAFGKGVFWCPWCDGFEHRDQLMGVLGDFSDAYDSVKELYPTLNKHIRIYANGTGNAAQINRLNGKNKDWQKVFDKYNVTVNHKPILNITRTQSGSEIQDSAIRKELDKFRVYFSDGSYEERDAFITNYGTSQASHLPEQLKVGFLGNKMNTMAPGLRTTVPGVWGVGDANSDNSTNVPHAMSTGKKAAVFCHGESEFYPNIYTIANSVQLNWPRRSWQKSVATRLKEQPCLITGLYMSGPRDKWVMKSAMFTGGLPTSEIPEYAYLCMPTTASKYYLGSRGCSVDIQSCVLKRIVSQSIYSAYEHVWGCCVWVLVIVNNNSKGVSYPQAYVAHFDIQTFVLNTYR